MSFLLSHVYSCETNEWYTPDEFAHSARKVMRGITLDPASCLLANQVIQAERIYSKEENGLIQEWYAPSVWLNPPFGRVGTDRQKGQTELWIQKLLDAYQKNQVTQAILLVNAYLYKQWFAPLWHYPICFPTGRLSFWNAQGQHGRSPHSSALVYLGPQSQRFVDEFSRFGPVIHVWQPSDQVSQTDLWSDDIAFDHARGGDA